MSNVRARTLRRAADIVGGVEVLAAQLDVRSEDLANWLAGTEPVPEDVFLGAVDIVTAHQVAEISGGYPNLKNTASKGPA